MVPAVELVALLAAAAAASPPPMAPEASAFLATDYRPIASLTGLPAPLAAALREELHGESIADRGQSFQVGDVRLDPPLPDRRFVAAGVAGDRWFVAYEHGGLGHHYHLLLYELDPAHARPRRTFHCRGTGLPLWRLDPAFRKRPPPEKTIQRWFTREVRTGACDARGIPDWDL
jgi:hypothetical protein